MRPGRGLLYGLIALMVAFWSGNFIVAKVALREFPPLLLSGLRVGLAGVLMLPVYWWEGRARSDRWKAEDAPLLIWLGKESKPGSPILLPRIFCRSCPAA